MNEMMNCLQDLTLKPFKSKRSVATDLSGLQTFQTSNSFYLFFLLRFVLFVEQYIPGFYQFKEIFRNVQFAF